MGIGPDDQSKLFKMFAKLRDTAQMNTNGVGLGLFICKQIVEQFNGRICVKSQQNIGSSFFFSFDVEDGRINQSRVFEAVNSFDLSQTEVEFA